MKNKYLPLLILSPFIFVLFWFRNGNIMGGGESGLPFYDLSRMLEISRYSWADPALGNSIGIGVAATPIYWILSQIENLGVPGFALEALWFWILFVISGISVWFLTIELFPRIQEKYLFLSVLFYWFNPLSLVNVWNRFLYNYMVFWAFLPLALLLFIKGIKKRDYRFAVLVSIFTTIFSYALTSPVFNILLWGLLFYTAIFFLLFEKGIRGFIAKYFLLTLASFTLFNFWWISQLFAFIFSADYNVMTMNFFTAAGNLGTLNSLSNSLGRLVNIFRFMHGTFFIDGPSWAKFYNLPIISGAGFLLTVVILWTIIKFKRIKEVLFLGILFILTLFLMKGNNPPFGEIFTWGFLQIPALQVFRNPLEKFGFLLPLAAAPLFSLGMEQLVSGGLKLVRIKRLVFWGVFGFVLLFLGCPFWTGLVFTSLEEGTGRIFNYEVKVPGYYREVNDWLKKAGSNFRFLSVPLDGEGITYNWEKPYSGVELSSTLFETPNISFNTTIPFYYDLVKELSNYQLNNKILSFSPFMNSRYIVWRSDIDFKIRGMANPQVVLAKLEEWVREGLLTKRYETGNLSIYEVSGSWFWPKIYSTPEIYVSNSKDLAFLSSFFDGFPQKKNVVIDVNNISSDLAYKKVIYVPDKIYFQSVTTPLPKDLTDDELLGKLFYANHLPGELIYPLVRINEKIMEIKEKDPDGLLLYKVGILGKRVAEIYKLKKLGKSASLIASTQKDYENELSNMSPHIVSLIKEGGPVASVVKDSLMYQWVLLGKVGLDSTTTLLSDLLSKWDVKPTFELPLSNNTYVVESFNILSDGEYILYGVGKGSIFIDGKELTAGNMNPLELKSGKHEVSLNLNDNEIYKDVVDQPGDIYIDQNNLQHWDFGIPNIPQKYQVEFDYRFDVGKTFGVKVVQDLENDASPSFNSKIAFNPKNYGWQHHDEEMDSAPGATKAYLSFSSVEEAFCNKLWWGWTSCGTQDSQFGVEIRNLRVREVDTPELSLVMNGSTKSDFPPSQTSFEEINPTFYKVHIDKSNNNPEVLVLSELYNTSWKLTYTNSEQIPNISHFLVNNYANGWVISGSGSYDLLINFAPQKILESGEKISLYSIIIAILVITLYTIWQKKHEDS